MSEADRLYQAVVCVTYQYLGPAAKRFVARTVQSHLARRPGQLQQEDLNNLTAWLCLAMGVICGDATIVEQFEADLTALLAPSLRAGKHNAMHTTPAP